ncbi:MAG: nicotinate-nucleotide pyrophosphorylase [Verrucomicrobiales bacterium]|jgi:nicotinate-nucleotide pyrophosphorylase (carboxylating)|nr:nicotinate-nucleotide pyrophosphorylase [Verrucomicrobiales bacterium]
MHLDFTPRLERLVNDALEEDIGTGDATTLALIPDDSQASALFVPRESIVLAGSDLVEWVFHKLDPSLQVRFFFGDGTLIAAGQPFCQVEGNAGPILTGERVSLNFLQRLSGIASATLEFVKLVEGTHCKILDTRKTLPGWRSLEKYAVACGGGQNHRNGLYDLILIKDNHLTTLRYEKPNAIAAAILRARAQFPKLKVEVEADTLEQVAQAIEAKADIVLLDNMTLEQLRQAVQMAQGRSQTEASGGVNLTSIRAIAETGVDFVSVGAITHSARAVDIGLDFENL